MVRRAGRRVPPRPAPVDSSGTFRQPGRSETIPAPDLIFPAPAIRSQMAGVVPCQAPFEAKWSSGARRVDRSSSRAAPGVATGRWSCSAALSRRLS